LNLKVELEWKLKQLTAIWNSHRYKYHILCTTHAYELR